MKRFVKQSGFDSDDATTVAHILAEFDGSDKKTSDAMIERLKEIYSSNYHAMINDKKYDKKK